MDNGITRNIFCSHFSGKSDLQHWVNSSLDRYFDRPILIYCFESIFPNLLYQIFISSHFPAILMSDSYLTMLNLKADISNSSLSSSCPTEDKYWKNRDETGAGVNDQRNTRNHQILLLLVYFSKIFVILYRVLFLIITEMSVYLFLHHVWWWHHTWHHSWSMTSLMISHVIASRNKSVTPRDDIITARDVSQLRHVMTLSIMSHSYVIYIR